MLKMRKKRNLRNLDNNSGVMGWENAQNSTQVRALQQS